MDLLCIGELLVDRIADGPTVGTFFGGAPANVAVNYLLGKPVPRYNVVELPEEVGSRLYLILH